MRAYGFSTGALARGDFVRGLALLATTDADAVELSALRTPELDPLLDALPSLSLTRYRYASVHAPSRFAPAEERHIVARLAEACGRGLHVVVHPDAIHEPTHWATLGEWLCLENMDKRKPVGRTADELEPWFVALPEAGLCLDVAHARQVDGSMTEAYRLLRRFGGRVRQVHVSEVDTASCHVRVTRAAAADYEVLVGLLPADAPIIIEAVVESDHVTSELAKVRALVDGPTSSSYAVSSTGASAPPFTTARNAHLNT